jgi:small conductance mechanosensitive channel
VDEVGQLLEPAEDAVRDIATDFTGTLPLVGIALLVAVVGIVLALLLTAGVKRAIARPGADAVAVGMVTRLVRIVTIGAVLLFALSIAGVPVGTALAGLGIAGLALAFAVQGILENFIAGLILLVRKPFRAGDQIRTNDFEGTVEDIDLRVTRMVDYDGELILIPNRDVYTHPLVNLTRRGSRRTTVIGGVDYRDDHDDAREVIRRSIAGVDGVLVEPAPEVLLTELGESSVNFEVRYWTAPDIASVRHTQDRVLAATKRGIQDAGMTIPWPIRTLVLDSPVTVEGR